MSLRSSSLLALPLLSLFALATACGGAVASESEQEINGSDPGSSSGSSGSNGGGVVQCTAIPTCDEGDTQLKGKRACAPDASCYERTLCGQTIRCETQLAQCAAYPSCQGGYVEVPSSQCNTKDCQAVTVCGYTIYCTPDEAQCDGYPSCDPGQIAVKSPAQCLPQGDTVCFPRSLCGSTIWCTGPISSADGGTPLPPGQQP